VPISAFDGLVAPAAGERVAAPHLEQQAGAAAGGVALRERDLVARAHRAALVAAGADAEAALRRRREVAAVVGEATRRPERLRAVARVHPQVGVERVGVNDLAWVVGDERLQRRLRL
jgi:hypothetical protein